MQDPRAGSVFRFPIVNGVVGSQADSTLSIPSTATGMAVGSDGTQYVGDYHNRISVFAPGAHGHDHPVRTIKVPYRPEEIVVGVDGYVFANQFSNGQSSWKPLVVIAPDGHIVRTIDLGLYDYYPEGLDARGNLYIMYVYGFINKVAVYATPETNPTLLRTSCIGSGGNDFVPDVAVSGGHLFVLRATTSRGRRVGLVMRARDTIASCPQPPEPELFLIALHVQPPVGILSDLNVADEHIFVLTNDLSSGPARLLEFPERGGPQVPLATVQWSGFVDPRVVATGP